MWPEQHRHHDCRTSTAALPTTRCSEAGHVARTDTTERQALGQPGRAEEDSRSREDDRHLLWRTTVKKNPRVFNYRDCLIDF